MRRLRNLSLPVSEKELALALGASVVVMSLLLYGLLWQSNIIVYQRDLIRSLWSWKYGG
jgi:hypothetical protein